MLSHTPTGIPSTVIKIQLYTAIISYVAINIQTIPGKFGGENVCLLWQITLFKRLAEKVWRMNNSAKRLLIVTML